MSWDPVRRLRQIIAAKKTLLLGVRDAARMFIGNGAANPVPDGPPGVSRLGK